MEPMILELNKKNCYVISHNQLITNVPRKKVEESVDSLSSGLPVKGGQVFTLDGRFSMSYAEKDTKITFSDGATSKKAVYYENNDKAKVLDWLIPYLEQNHFNPNAEAVLSSKLLMRGLGWIILVLIFFGLLFAAEGDSSVRSGKGRIFVAIADALGRELILIIGAVALLAAIIWTIVHLKKGDSQITYRK